MGGRKPSLKHRGRRRIKEQKENVNTLYAKGKRKGSSTNDLLGLLDDLLHNLLHHGVALLLATDGSILGGLR